MFFFIKQISYISFLLIFFSSGLTWYTYNPLVFLVQDNNAKRLIELRF